MQLFGFESHPVKWRARQDSNLWPLPSEGNRQRNGSRALQRDRQWPTPAVQQARVDARLASDLRRDRARLLNRSGREVVGGGFRFRKEASDLLAGSGRSEFERLINVNIALGHTPCSLAQ
jgi:hypothetical protein